MSKYYLVGELDNDAMCFESIEDIKEAAFEEGYSLESVTIYDTEMVKLKLDALSIVDTVIENDNFFEDFDAHEVDENKIKKLQEYLNEWCNDIDTNTYQRSKKLSIEEVYKRLEQENGN